MPAITAKHQPAVITIHPEFSAFDRFSNTPATTPSPSRIIIMVPMNSPKNGDFNCLLLDLDAPKSPGANTINQDRGWSSTQSKERVTAFFQSRKLCSRASLSIRGFQV